MMVVAFRAFDTPLRSYSGRTVIPMQSKTAKPIAIFEVSVLHVYKGGLRRVGDDCNQRSLIHSALKTPINPVGRQITYRRSGKS